MGQYRHVAELSQVGVAELPNYAIMTVKTLQLPNGLMKTSEILGENA